MAEERQPQWMRNQERERIGAQAQLARADYAHRPPEGVTPGDTPARVIGVIAGILAIWTFWHVIRWAQAGYIVLALDDFSFFQDDPDELTLPWWIRDPIGEPFAWFVAPVLGLLLGLGVHTLVRCVGTWRANR